MVQERRQPDMVTQEATTAAKIGEDAEIGASQRRLRPWEGQLVFWGCVGYTLFHLIVLNLAPMDPWLFRSAHVSFGSAIGFMLFAGTLGGRRRTGVPIADWILALASVACFVYIYVFLDDLLFRTGAA
ncbi:MAG TPA: hypothetical protein VM491_07485, partial [Burkholderiaceae bacterium]|nr:hypothetical protein [Burkholderiaceae bacterium]